jgi:hypothetical protein
MSEHIKDLILHGKYGDRFKNQVRICHDYVNKDHRV